MEASGEKGAPAPAEAPPEAPPPAPVAPAPSRSSTGTPRFPPRPSTSQPAAPRAMQIPSRAAPQIPTRAAAPPQPSVRSPSPKSASPPTRRPPSSIAKPSSLARSPLPLARSPPPPSLGVKPLFSPPQPPLPPAPAPELPKEEPPHHPLAGANVMNVVMVASECAPWSKTGTCCATWQQRLVATQDPYPPSWLWGGGAGGLGDVVGALPKALARRGHRVMVSAAVPTNRSTGVKQEK